MVYPGPAKRRGCSPEKRILRTRFCINLCALDLFIHSSIFVSARISTLQHYDTMEIIALGAETCVCMFVSDQ
jgi:hypothetical protein